MCAPLCACEKENQLKNGERDAEMLAVKLELNWKIVWVLFFGVSIRSACEYSSSAAHYFMLSNFGQPYTHAMNHS